MTHYEFGWTTKDGLRIYAQGWQPETEPRAVLCIVHGLGEHGGRYARQAAVFVEAGCAVLIFDQRGFGKSQGRRGHTPGYAALLDDIAVLLQEAERQYPHVPLFLYGHSMGGNLVLNYVLRRKPFLKGVIATGPWLRLAFTPPAYKIFLAGVMNVIWPSFTQANGIRASELSHDRDDTEAYEKDPLVHDRISARMFLSVFQAGLWALEKAHEFNLPLLLMHGGDDRITSPEASSRFAAKAGEKCTLRIWPGLYHELLNEPDRPEAREYMLGWIEELATS